jgi:hypothetical protein
LQGAELFVIQLLIGPGAVVLTFPEEPDFIPRCVYWCLNMITIIVMTHLILGSFEVEYALVVDVFHSFSKIADIRGIDIGVDAGRDSEYRFVAEWTVLLYEHSAKGR